MIWLLGLMAFVLVVVVCVWCFATRAERRRRHLEMTDAWAKWREYQRRLAAGEVGPNELPAADPRLIHYPA